MIIILNKATINGCYIAAHKQADTEPINTQDNITADNIKEGNRFDYNANRPITNFYVGDFYYYLILPIDKNEDGTYSVNLKNGCPVEIYNDKGTVEVFPSLREFCNTFELPYSFAQNRKTDTPIVWNGSPCDVRYPKKGSVDVTYESMNEASFQSRCDNLVKAYLNASTKSSAEKDDTSPEGLVKNNYIWNYKTHKSFDDKYAINIINRQSNREVVNCSNNNRYEFMRYILDCLVNMILYKSEKDRQFPPAEDKYNYKWEFKTKEDIWKFFKDNPQITTSLLSNAMQMLLNPKDMNVAGIALGYSIAYLYMTSQKDKHDAHELSEVYVDKHFNLKIKNKSGKNIPYAF